MRSDHEVSGQAQAFAAGFAVVILDFFGQVGDRLVRRIEVHSELGEELGMGCGARESWTCFSPNDVAGDQTTLRSAGY